MRVLVTGATDGIGLEAAKKLAADGHELLIHGRSETKLANVLATLPRSTLSFQTDLSDLNAVAHLAQEIAALTPCIDVLINNAGIYKTADEITGDGLDVRFAVNTIAPFMLACPLVPVMSSTARIVNVSSAAQAPVDLDALAGNRALSAGAAYAQSKLALNMWTNHLTHTIDAASRPILVSVNPGSLLASKMVKEAFGIAGSDIQIGADILARAAVSDAFNGASGLYFDNDAGDFGPPHPDALDAAKCANVTTAIKQTVDKVLGS